MIRKYASLLILGTALWTGTAAAQERGTPVQPVPPNVLSDSSAQDTRQQLRELLRGYPPSLGQVLALDNSLLNNPDYLSPYPRLGAFLAQHPEVLRNPSYFVGQNGVVLLDRDSNAAIVQDMVEPLAAFCVFLTVLGALGLLVKTIIDHRRWLRMSKMQGEVHTKLLDRFTASEDLLAYIQTPAGKRFLESAPIATAAGPSVSAPVGRIMLSIQVGVVLTCGGIGLFLVSRRFESVIGQPFFVLGALGLALGIGFVLSAVVSYMISRSLGLMRGPDGPTTST